MSKKGMDLVLWRKLTSKEKTDHLKDTVEGMDGQNGLLSDIGALHRKIEVIQGNTNTVKKLLLTLLTLASAGGIGSLTGSTEIIAKIIKAFLF